VSFVKSFGLNFSSCCHDVTEKVRQHAGGLTQVATRKGIDRMSEAVMDSSPDISENF
jgi:hypothetical protein